MSTVGPAASALVVLVVACGFRAGLRRPRDVDSLAAPAGTPTRSVPGPGRRTAGIVGRRRSRREIEQAWPEAIELLVHAVQAGLTPRQAVAHLVAHAPSPTRPGFAAVVHRTERGQPLADALRALPDVLGSCATGVADVIGTGDRYGLPLAPVLEQLAGEARDTRRRLGQVAARKLPVKLAFPLVVCTLPSFVLLAIAPAVIAALSSLGGTAW